MGRIKVAFVGSGGGFRGLAHLGVLRACEELGLLPEVFVGTSSSALIGATYGQEIPLDVLLDAYRLPWRRRHRGPRLFASTFLGLPGARDFLDPGYLFSGLLSADRLEAYLARSLPINDFRRLPNSVFVTAVDIDTGERVVFGPGYEEATPISRAVAASCCVPGLFRPYRIGGRYLVNGEVARTLSADVAIEAGADVVIISNVYRPEQRGAGQRSLARLGPFGVLRQSLSVLLSEKERQGVELLRKLHPRVVFLDVAPEIGSFSYLNRYAVRSLVLRGYRKALRVLADAKERGVFEGAGASAG
jgi:NTE family protein